MRCINCDTENKSDAVYCRNCGKHIRKCANCDAVTESDARYCRKCGNPTGALPEDQNWKTAGQGEPAGAAHAEAAAEDEPEVDFTTRVSARRVEPLHAGGGHGRGARVALYVALAVVVGCVLAAVVMMWLSTRAMQRQTAAQAAERRADLTELTKLITETRDEDRKAVYEDLKEFFTARQEEERKAMRAEYRQFVTQRLEEERQAFGRETAQAVAQVRDEERSRLMTVLAEWKATTRSSIVRSEIQKIMARLGKVGGNGQRERAGYKTGRAPRRLSDHNLTD